MSFEKVQHLVDVDENIFASFVVDPSGNISAYANNFLGYSIW
jgi:hypothetical protein